MTSDSDNIDDTKKLIFWMRTFVVLTLATIVIFGGSFIWACLSDIDVERT